MDLEGCVLYRMAYGLAADLAEGAEQNYPGRWRNNAAAGAGFEVILAEVMKRIHVERSSGQGVVREAVEDALAG